MISLLLDVSDVKRRRIFVDDPLPPREMTAVEKNAFFNNLAVKYEFTNFVNKSRYYTLSGSRQLNKTREKLLKPLIKKSSDIFDDVTDLSSLETFGVEKLGTPCISQPSSSESDTDNEKEVKDNSNIKSASNSEKEDSQTAGIDSDSEASLIIDLGDNAPSAEKNLNKKTETPRNDSTNLLNSILQEQEKLLMASTIRKESKKNITALSDDTEDPSEYTPPQYNKNVTYRVHGFRVNQRSLRLLVRSSVDTAVVTYLSLYKSKLFWFRKID